MQTRRLKISLVGILTRTFDIMHSSSSFTSFGLDRTAVFRICSLDVYLKAGLAKYAWWCIDFASHDFKSP